MDPIRAWNKLTFKSALNFFGAVVLYTSGQLAFAVEDTVLSGKVIDPAGRPVADATVMVYHAGQLKGYSLFCPSCYADCGKRAHTDGNGSFVFPQLRRDLWFELLVAKAGYQPKFLEKVIPSAGTSVNAVLETRKRISDPRRVFRGQVLDDHGIPQRNAVVQPVGGLWDAKSGNSMYGPIPGLEPIAVTDSGGIFEIDSLPSGQKLMPGLSGPPLRILVSTEARGMAEKFSVIPAGRQVHRVTVSVGAIVRGRLVQDGKPVGGAEVGLIGYPRGGWASGLKMSGSAYDEIRIGTRPDGTFEIDNVPVSGTWYVYSKMESVAKRGSTGNVRCATDHNGEIVELGDLKLRPAFHVRGMVVLSDGKPIDDGMRVTISASEAWDSQSAFLPSNGQFEFVGLAAGNYSIFASVKGYSPPPMSPVSSKTKDGRTFTYTPPPPPLSILRDVDDFTMTLQPDKAASTN